MCEGGLSKQYAKTMTPADSGAAGAVYCVTSQPPPGGDVIGWSFRTSVLILSALVSVYPPFITKSPGSHSV